MRLLWLLFVSSFISLAVAVENTNHGKIEYKDISSMLDFVINKARSPFIKNQVSVTLVDETLKFSDLKLWITKDNQILKDIIVGDEGKLELPIYSKADSKKTWLNINQPKGAVSLNMSLEFNIGDKTAVPYYDLFILLEDFNDYMGEMAGMASWLMPDMDEMKFVFDQPAIIEINSNKKKYFYKTNKKHEISIDVRKKLMKENPIVKFSISPSGMYPED